MLGRLAPDLFRHYKATELNPTAQSHTSSRGLGQWERIMSQPAQTALHCLSLSAGLSKGRRAICPEAKHTFVFPKLYGFPRLDRESKLSVKYVVTFTAQDMVRKDRRSLLTHNYRSSVKKKKNYILKTSFNSK